MKIFPSPIIADIDRYTIEHEPISSLDLMERASVTVCDWLLEKYPHKTFYIFVGPGNNGGDALVVTRLLSLANQNVTTLLVADELKHTDDYLINLDRLKQSNKVEIITVSSVSDIPDISSEAIIVDGIFGNGFNRPLTGYLVDIIQFINHLQSTIIAIDVPSGLMSEDNSNNNREAIIKANTTLTFQFPKLAFLFPENEQFVGRFEVLDIQLHPEIIRETATINYLVEEVQIQHLLKTRKQFSHKGNFGHALLLSGSKGKMGAAILNATACLRSGCGLLSVAVSQIGVNVLQTAIPEAMVVADVSADEISTLPELSKYNAIGIGSGIGVSIATTHLLHQLLKASPKNLVLDADAINILGENRDELNLLPRNTILTPHPKEFQRIAGSWQNDFERLELLRSFAQKHQVYVVLKGAFTTIATPSGQCFFNSTGNAGMATAGSGDVLTGIIVGLLAQGYDALNACLIGVYIHGLAGDIALSTQSQESLIASDIIAHLGKAFIQLHQ